MIIDFLRVANLRFPRRKGSARLLGLITGILLVDSKGEAGRTHNLGFKK